MVTAKLPLLPPVMKGGVGTAIRAGWRRGRRTVVGGERRWDVSTGGQGATTNEFVTDVSLTTLGSVAADAASQAIMRGVLRASGAQGWESVLLVVQPPLECSPPS